MKRLSCRNRFGPKDGGCPAWMMTFGDCMSLLVCFFVMLIAFSNMEEEQLSNMLGAMRGALGAADVIGEIDSRESQLESDGLSPPEGDLGELRLLTMSELASYVPQLVADVSDSDEAHERGWPDRVLIRMLDEGLSIIVLTSVLFHNGTGEWKAGDDVLWVSIARLLEDMDNRIRVVALICPESPVHDASVRTFWGLGLQRADAVAGRLRKAMDASVSRFGIGVQVVEQTGPPERIRDAVEITILGRHAESALQAAGGLPGDSW